jgi:hypothetical protein
LKLIEERETSKPISPEKLNNAMLTMLHARMICYTGNVPDALTIYDNVFQTIAADPEPADQRQADEIARAARAPSTTGSRSNEILAVCASNE